jgi:diaminopropionate ammonia-lyase
MAGEISFIANSISRQSTSPSAKTSPFSPSTAARVRKFHRSLTGYWPTPLESLPDLAKELRVQNIWVKDESFRFGLNAFKVLGASYALLVSLSEKFGLPAEGPSFENLKTEPYRSELRRTTITTATDGNHGRAVAWSAKQAGCPSVVYMPGNSSPARVEAIRFTGAEVIVIDGNYDDAVEMSRSESEKHDRLLIQDSSWPGYETIPVWIMQGYLTIMDEVIEQLGGDLPSHVFIQCGVGSFAAALQAYWVERLQNDRPLLAVVEPARAACFYESIRHPSGRPQKIAGNLDTLMAGLACGEPSLLAWEILKDYADFFVTCQDSVSKKGMIRFGRPTGADPRIISGESGAVTLGLLELLQTHICGVLMSKAVQLDEQAKVLLISTEGDTDPEMYRQIVGKG